MVIPVTFDLDIYPENPVFMQVCNNLQTQKNDPALFHARTLFTMSGLMLLPYKQDELHCQQLYITCLFKIIAYGAASKEMRSSFFLIDR